MFHVRGELDKIRQEKYQRFFDIISQLGAPNSPTTSKVAAAYELRKYPQYKDVIVRLARDVGIDGQSAELLKRELDLTVKHFGGLGRSDILKVD